MMILAVSEKLSWYVARSAGFTTWGLTAFAVLWGLLAFLLNFVPNIGSILAAVPAVLMALLLNGLPSALLVAGGYVVINVLIGNVVEPRIMGEGLGLSTLVVFLSLILCLFIVPTLPLLCSIAEKRLLTVKVFSTLQCLVIFK